MTRLKSSKRNFMVSVPMIKDGMKIIRSSSFAENFNMLDRRACIKTNRIPDNCVSKFDAAKTRPLSFFSALS